MMATDVHSPETRSYNMSRIRGKDTKPELMVRSLLHSMGYRFRLKNPQLPGRPDLILARYKTAVFVHGCFWHRHAGCRYASIPKARAEFWHNKFESNMRQDREVSEQLKAMGWNQLILWECEIKDKESLVNKIRGFFSGLQ